MNTAIIDYASPASRATLRLPARSEIRWDFHPARRELRVVQVLAGRLEAVGALALAAFTFVLMAVQIAGMAPRWNRYSGQIALLGTFMAAEAVLSAFVINNTWRRTTLTVTPEQMTLTMTAPFGGGQKFTFPAEQVAGVNVVDSQPLPGEAVVPELEIRMWSIPPLRLFTGHPQSTLLQIAAAITQVQPLSMPPAPPTLPPATGTAAPAAAPTPQPPAPTVVAPAASPPVPAAASPAPPGFTVNL